MADSPLPIPGWGLASRTGTSFSGVQWCGWCGGCQQVLPTSIPVSLQSPACRSSLAATPRSASSSTSSQATTAGHGRCPTPPMWSSSSSGSPSRSSSTWCVASPVWHSAVGPTSLPDWSLGGWVWAPAASWLCPAGINYPPCLHQVSTEQGCLHSSSPSQTLPPPDNRKAARKTAGLHLHHVLIHLLWGTSGFVHPSLAHSSHSHPFIHTSIWPPAHLSSYPSVHLFTHPPVHLSVYPSVRMYLSISSEPCVEKCCFLLPSSEQIPHVDIVSPRTCTGTSCSQELNPKGGSAESESSIWGPMR